MLSLLSTSSTGFAALRVPSLHRASHIIMQAGADPEPEDAAMKLASAVPPVFAVVEDTAYEPSTIGFDANVSTASTHAQTICLCRPFRSRSHAMRDKND